MLARYNRRKIALGRDAGRVLDGIAVAYADEKAARLVSITGARGKIASSGTPAVRQTSKPIWTTNCYLPASRTSFFIYDVPNLKLRRAT